MRAAGSTAGAQNPLAVTVTVTKGGGPGRILGAHQCLSAWIFLHKSQGLSLSECPWQPHGKGVSLLHQGPKTPQSRADLPASGVTGTSRSEGFHLFFPSILR